jgi:plasmid stabilization system protein ParE
MFDLIIKEEAYQDLQNAYDYYEEQKSGLGEDFIAKVKGRMAYLKKYPLHFSKVEKEFRQALIDRFPYVIVYELSGKEIIVYAVFHCSKNPRKKFKI